MKKIAIMTWYTHRNYGTALQACATNYITKKMGYDPMFIQYLPKRGAYKYDFTCFYNRCKIKIDGVLNPIYKTETHEAKYNEFLNRQIKQTQKCDSYAELHDLNEKFDAFICGSDQIWSPLNHDDKYFLSFVQNTDKMVAYAPSLGVNELEDPLIAERMKKLIDRFKYLSVREKQGAEMIRQLTGKIPQVVLDPTLLMDAHEWDEVADTKSAEKIENNNYIICYFLGDDRKYLHYVRALAKKLQVPYYVIPVKKHQKKTLNAVPFEVGPAEFVSLIRNAKYVCTDSFHGIAFAVNYNVPFSAFKRFKDSDSKNQNSRIYNILDMIELKNRLYSYNNVRIDADILNCDFTKANEVIQNKRIESIEFLKTALDTAVNVVYKKKNESMVITDTCCGCGACASVCKFGAISIQKNDDGFEHYDIDKKKCVLCGKCRSVCPMTNIIAPTMKNSRALYAIKSNSANVLRKSSSGGIGHELAREYLSKNYAVCGCVYDHNEKIAKHIWVYPGEEEKLSLLQGSKYIQSVSSDALKEIEEIVQKNKVLFFGTPCQAAAVDKILREQGMREQALIVDLICHGVPTYHLWSKYVNEISEENGLGMQPKVLFRDKDHKSRQRVIRLEGNGHIFRRKEQKDDFYAFFRRGISDMSTCFECPYRERSAADLRIGDYWGDRFAKENYGMSMVIANSCIGEEIIGNLGKSEKCKVQEYDLSEYWTIQNTKNPAHILIRDQLIEELKEETQDIHALRKKYCIYYDIEEFVFRTIKEVKRIYKR